MKTPPNSLPVFLESLEPRIAPAGLGDAVFKATPAGTSILLTAGEGLSTSDGGGAYLLYVEKGSAMVFTTDLNADNRVNFNEITGIAAGDGLRLISFADINGDIVTNLGKDGRLTDSDGDASNGYDGKVVLNSRIESIVLRSLVPGEVADPFGRLAKSSYSINGNVYAGAGLGLASGGSGLLIDTSGFADQATKFGATQTISDSGTPIPSVGFIFTGTATSGQYFSFGTSPIYGDGPAESLRDRLVEFVPAAGQTGGDVFGLRAVGANGALAPFMLGGIVTGDGGFGANGGNISGLSITGDVGGLLLRTGHGGDGEVGGNGGSILNLNVSGSINSHVEIATGNGGAGLTGKAGQAGNVVLDGDLQIFGRVTVGLGKGGDAFGNAGTGTSISSGTFVNIDPGTFLPAGFVTTWRSAGDIGDQRLIDAANPANGYRTNQFDVDGDGFNDAVVLTDNPNQLFVAFGNANPLLPGTFDPTRTYFLPSPSYAAASERTSAVVVLDANNDGLPDIVSGQSTGDGFSGVIAYINLGTDPLDGSWLGFATPRYSPLPDLGGPGNTPEAIINLVAGDFDRDGKMDLGVMSMGRTSNVTPPYYAYIAVMKGLVDATGKPDGFFALDFGKGTGNVPTLIPFSLLGRSDNPDFSFVLKATAAEAGNPATDLMAVISKGGEEGTSVTAALDRGRALATFSVDSGVLVKSLADLSYTEREVGDTGGNRQGWIGYGDSFDLRAADFIVADVDGDGAFDAVVVGRPTGDGAPSYLVAATLQGDVSGGISQPIQFDNVYFQPYEGIALTERRENLSPPVASVLNRDFQTIPVLRMVGGDFDNDPTTVNFVLNGINLLTKAEPPTSQVAYFAVTGFGQYNDEFVAIPGPGPLLSKAYTPVGAQGTAFHTSFFGYYEAARGLTAGLEDGVPTSDGFWLVVSAGSDPVLSPDRVFWFPIAASTLSLSAGSGGWSLLGNGGAGGSVGGGFFGGSAITATGFLRYNFEGAAGGFGLLAGGRAGNVSGVDVFAYHNFEPGQITLLTSEGGSSLLGGGGSGGGISQFQARTQFSPDGGVLVGSSLARGPFVTLDAGAGGSGLIGGFGGSVLGRGDSFSPDSDTPDLLIRGGEGGYGMKLGGNGGEVTGLFMVFRERGGVDILSGPGGNSAAGSGGAGGNVAVRPSSLINELDGSLALEASGGGDGLTGGAGGSIKDFINIPTTGENPATLKALAGDGGAGVTGNGGAGGSIAGFQVTTADTLGGVAVLMAGGGGASSGAVGGLGGSLNSVTVTSVAGAMVAVAGAGGDGFRAGGVGGALSTTSMNAGGLDNARVVAMAGKGGNAYAVSAATVLAENNFPSYSQSFQRNVFAMGTANGIGAAGGSITDFTQPAALKTSVDLVAGNGGSTINYGKILSQTTGVGRGGSMLNVNLANNAGVIASDVAIRAYAIDFARDLRNGDITAITNDTGNVGVVVGSAGSVRNDLPSQLGVAGSISNFRAQNIMSMIAGSVDRIAAITSVTGVQLQNGGTQIGVAKNTYLNPNDGSVDTFNPPDPVPRPHTTTYWSSPDSLGTYKRVLGSFSGLLGGALIDGAIVTENYSGPPSDRVFAPKKL